MKSPLELDINSLDFDKLGGLLPAVVQDAQTGKVLMTAFMNKAAAQKTIDSGLATFYSRSRQTLWTKGETSGNTLSVKEILPDCDRDTLLLKVTPAGPTCHTGADTCFNEENTGDLAFLYYLENLLKDRKKKPTENSYTSKLFQKGINKVAQKVGEEAVELVIEAKDADDDLFINEAADLFFHTMMLLVEKGRSLDEVVQTLKGRHK